MAGHGAQPGERRGGRSRGTPNKRTIDGEAYARAIVEDAEVRATLLRQAQEGTLPADLMKTLMLYAYGRPQDMNSHGDSETRTIQITF